ncbi:expressed unknown protein [Seminavis robusta]|uniref:Uncharacterized protein n=1 Tax=Seminavis robusta TaxID=568900 RepID=A0A9N8DUR3_9STRA|nr:expressed unknown protein [Seminavis robusta]|eukprot:Sro365_g127460.1 n/a (151) ;mRNA; f:66957-67409
MLPSWSPNNDADFFARFAADPWGECPRKAAACRQRRRQELVSLMEDNGVGSAEHLRALNLEQLEEMYKMSGSYDEEHFQYTADGSSSSSFPFHSIWKSLLESKEIWQSFMMPECLNLYHPTTFTADQPQEAEDVRSSDSSMFESPWGSNF